MRWYYFPLPILFAVLVLYRVADPGPEYTGKAQIIDGDTIKIGSTRIRLHGIDAPESYQNCTGRSGRWPCGREATKALRGLVGDAELRCKQKDRDSYGRAVAVCFKGGQDINAWMVENGLAAAYRRYSQDYVDEETEAREAKAGIWAGQFEMPWEWRRKRQ